MANEPTSFLPSVSKYLVMEQKDLNDVLFAADYTLKFYGKPMEKIHKQVWSRTIIDSGYTSHQWQGVLREWPSIGKFAPRPSEILEQLNLRRENKPRQNQQAEPVTTDCPAEIADAWRYWIPRFWGQPLPDRPPAEDQPDMEDEYLMTVNREARKAKMPEAIPDAYKLREVWGDI